MYPSGFGSCLGSLRLSDDEDDEDDEDDDDDEDGADWTALNAHGLAVVLAMFPSR